ncbi:S8 family serine peptidase [Streptomyces sp. SID486]|uniref:S8 family peptidase n=1 Tax=Streptomyces sp. SID486 TaxID=2690264 RepID=UPI00136FC179|nr:S8 family peptidase [Streptomyces sp. SID486]MYX93660.1 S8 family serine peptidase [Streptomyces sp. SID486]
MAITTQTGAPWGISRISQRPKPTAQTFERYVYDVRAGEGVDIYVLDSGVHTAHLGFAGRARHGVDVTGTGHEDTVGRGTLLAGTAASAKHGVAKNASIIAVKVVKGNALADPGDIAEGLAWTTEQARSSGRPSVALIGACLPRNRELDERVDTAARQGLFVVVPAGDDSRDARDYSPSGASGAFTVGACDIRDARAYFSNHGPGVDVFAPGHNIPSTYIGGPNAATTGSGTAQAAAHIAGLAAYLLSITDGLTTTTVPDAITTLATRDLLTAVPAPTSNLLAFNNATT